MIARGTRPPVAAGPPGTRRRWPLAALLGVLVVAGSAGVAVAQTTVPTLAPTTPPPTLPTTVSTFRPTTTTFKPTTTTFKPVTTTPFRPPSTLPTTTLPLTTTTLPTTTTTEAPTTTTTAPTTTTTAAPAPVEPASSTGKLPFVVFGLLLVGAAIAVLTFLFWRHTRPVYDDYYDDDVSGPAPAIARLDVVEDDDLGAPGFAADGEPTVVVKPKSELQPAGVGASDAAAGPGAGAGAGAGAAVLAGGAAAGALASRKAPQDRADDQGGDQPHDGDEPLADDGPLESVVPVAAVAPAVARERDAGDGEADAPDRWDDEEPPTVAHDALDADDDVVEAFGREGEGVLVAPGARHPAPAAHDDDAYDEPLVYDEHGGYSEHEDDDGVALAHDAEGEDEDGYGHAGYEEQEQQVELDDEDDGGYADDPPFVDPAPAREPVSPSAVTILGPMRPGTSRDDIDADGVTLEPDPLEIVTLEDIERARTTRGRRPSARGNGSDRRG